MSKSRVDVRWDLTKKIKETIEKFKNEEVLVGIPEEDTKRQVDSNDKTPVNNATLLAINIFGSPDNNIPARPVMQIGIKNAQKEIIETLKQGARAVLSKGYEALDIYYGRAGSIAANSIKKTINSQEDIKPPAESTIKAREARGFKGKKALLVTGQMRNAITYVLNNKKVGTRGKR